MLSPTSWLPIVYPFLVALLFVTILVLNDYSARRPRVRLTKLKLDDAVPFVPGFAIPYLSAYVLGNMAFVVLHRHWSFPKVLLGYVTIYLFTSLCYLLYPTRVERREDIVATSVSTRLLAAFQGVAKPFNVFPSMHASYCLFSGLTVLHYSGMWLGVILLSWAGLVVLSTLLTKQHCFLDIVAGAIVGTSAFLITQL